MDQKGGTPKLVCGNHAMPVFYRDVMYREDTEEKDGAYLKLYDGHDWKWFRVSLSHTDMEYLRKNWAGKRAAAPVLEKRYRKYFLCFFLYRRSAAYKGTCKRTDHLQCGFRDQYGCSLYHHAAEMELSWKKIY